MIVLIHGLGQSPDSWKQTAAQLTIPQYNTCPDFTELLQGQEATYPNLYTAFAAYCAKQNAPLDLCGLSLGGVLALNYAIEHPETVRSLVLIAAQYNMPKNLLRFQNLLFRFLPKSAFRQMGFEKADMIQLCKTMLDLDFRASLKQVSCPTLVVCGEKDTANKTASTDLASLLPNAELRIISGAGHEVNTEAPEQLAKVLQSFYHTRTPNPGSAPTPHSTLLTPN